MFTRPLGLSHEKFQSEKLNLRMILALSHINDKG